MNDSVANGRPIGRMPTEQLRTEARRTHRASAAYIQTYRQASQTATHAIADMYAVV